MSRFYQLVIVAAVLICVTAWPQLPANPVAAPTLPPIAPPVPRGEASPPIGNPIGPLGGEAAESAPNAPGPPPGSAAGQGAPVPPLLPMPVEFPEGDVVTLKNGKILRGVQVSKTTLTEVHVITVLVPGADMEPLVVPRKYVASIDYDDYDPNAAQLQASQAPSTSELVTGIEVSKDLGEKLHVKLPPELLRFQNRDFVEILGALSQQSGVSIEVSAKVRALPVRERLWTLETTEDTTLFTLLHQKLPAKFPDVVVDYQYDKVVVVLQDEKAPAPESAGAPDVASPATPSS